MLLNPIEEVIWSGWQQRRNTVEIARIVNKVPEFLCGRSELFSEAEIHRLLSNIKDRMFLKQQKKG